MNSWAAAYKAINFNISSQLPEAMHGKSYSYSFAVRITGGKKGATANNASETYSENVN